MDSVREFEPKLFSAVKAGLLPGCLIKDAIGGLIVAIIALPLSMAFAIGSGVGPEKGLYTAIVGGFFISLLGGSRLQIGGPAGAFVVVLYGIIMRQGFDGLVIACLMAGVIMIGLGLLRLGTIIKYIPYPVTKGFTAGIAVIIFISQINDFLGMGLKSVPSEFFHKIGVFVSNITNIDPLSVGVAVVSLLIVIFSAKFTTRVPGPFLAVVFGVAVVMLLRFPVETIESRFGTIPSTLPLPSLPSFTLEKIRLLLPDAITIALLGAIESLMSAVVADGLSGDRHRSNMELVAQGTANIFTAIFGGIPATGTTARTVTNIKSGSVSPMSGIFHAMWLLLFMFLLAPLIVKIPFATLAAILVVVAYNMSEVRHLKNVFHAPRSDIAVFLVTFGLTVIVDLNVAVQVGMLLACLLFIRRVTMMTHIRDSRITLDDAQDAIEVMDDKDAISRKVVPAGVEVYEISGPFFFGVADRLKSTIENIRKKPKVFILRMRHVPFVDATGMFALEEMCRRSRKNGTQVILSGVNDYVRENLMRAEIHTIIGEENIVDHIDKALKRAREIIG